MDTTKSKNYSVFLVTINTNMRTTTQNTPEVAGFMRHTLNLMFNSENILGLVKFIDGKKNFKALKEADVQFAIERGRSLKGSRLHAHALVRIYHDTKIHLDRTAIKEFVLEDMNAQLAANGFRKLSSVYVNIRAQKGSEFNLQRYLEKTGKSKRVDRV
jgi:hypothetical protein